MNSTKTLYRRYVKPAVEDTLELLRLDLRFHHASDDRGYYRNNAGEGIGKFDIAGGMDASALGQNDLEINKGKRLCPDGDICAHAQGSVHDETDPLGECLNELFPGSEPRIAIFANTGVETVEAALKSAVFNHALQLREFGESIHRSVIEARAFFCLNNDTPLPEEYRRAGFDFLCSDILQQTKDLMALRPVVIVAERSFHGKTAGAVRVAGNPMYRDAFKRLSDIDARFIEFNNAAALEAALKESFHTARRLAVGEHGIEIQEERFMNTAAFIMEPVPLEGGVHIATQEFMRGVERLRSIYGFEWILDEIQSGMGRTGRLFAVEHYKIDMDSIDYICLSRALGGGKDKIGSLMIREGVHNPQCDMPHASKFEEGGESAREGLNTLEILTRHDNRLMRQIGEKGNYLIEGLRRLNVKYPDIIREVRGLGLLIGVEFNELENSPSLFFHQSSIQGALGGLLSDYLFHEHRIRTAPHLLNSIISEYPSNSIRIEPSGFISKADMDCVIEAIDRVCGIIESSWSFFARNSEQRSNISPSFPRRIAKPPAGRPMMTALSRTRAARTSSYIRSASARSSRSLSPLSSSSTLPPAPTAAPTASITEALL